MIVTVALAASCCSSTLAPEAAQNLTETGLGNPITAVLIAYRSFDTMFEMVVLVLAVVGVWPLAPNRYWGASLEHPRAATVTPAMSAATPGRLIGAALGGFAFTTSSPIPSRCARFSLSILSAATFFCCSASSLVKAQQPHAADPVPQAMVIAGIVVAFSASAIAITLVLRLFRETGRVTLRPDAFVKPPANGADNW